MKFFIQIPPNLPFSKGGANVESLQETIKRGTEQCVKCGLCLAHCPTYAVAKHEAESPRGRIALMEGVATGVLPHSPALQTHLDNCLGCMACESVCPAEVPYSQLLTATRALLHGQQHQPPLPWLLNALCHYPWIRRLAALLAAIYHRLHLGALTAKIPGWSRLSMDRYTALLPQPVKILPWKRVYRSAKTATKTVGLLLPCTEWLDAQTISDSIQVLNHLGLDVVMAKQQTCCGALHLHQGALKEFSAFAKQTAGCWDNSPVATLVSTVTGCTAIMKNYEKYLISTNTTNTIHEFSERIQDIMVFLHQLPAFRQYPFKPYPQKVLLHTPCTLSNTLKQSAAVCAALERLPGIQITPFSEKIGCCGAAGVQMLQNENHASRILLNLIDEKRLQAADVIATTNTPCRLHLQKTLRILGYHQPIVHPISLFAKHLSQNP